MGLAEVCFQKTRGNPFFVLQFLLMAQNKGLAQVQLWIILLEIARCFYLRQDALLPLAIFRVLDWTIKHGPSDFSSVAFASTELMLIAFFN